MPRRPQPGRDIPPRNHRVGNSLLPFGGFGMPQLAMPRFPGHTSHGIHRQFYEDPFDTGNDNGRRNRARILAEYKRLRQFKAQQKLRQYGMRGTYGYQRGVRPPPNYSRNMASPYNRLPRHSPFGSRAHVRPSILPYGARRQGGLFSPTLPHRSPLSRRPPIPMTMPSFNRHCGTGFHAMRGLPPMRRNMQRPSYSVFEDDDDDDDYEDDDYNESSEFGDDDDEDDRYTCGRRGAFQQQYSSWGYDRSDDDDDEYACDDQDDDGFSNYTSWYGRQYPPW
ncbi:hypothetical protein P154DRAFT_531269 [Amniculicola lignicola CBS 123094]|uniref:Uncharacterized protein n=1 Tax=Amniculicola lignicola CBS 123094 TaxID=1392246 RepID=A0A6A5WVD1_9PLEO|nr:hypothetical protein P154DRAFT_531269 [Amniculicola lignicola CBS 123094]